MKNSIGGALCYQQISPRSRVEGDQHRQSHGAHEVCVFNLQVQAVLTVLREKMYAEGGILSVTSRILVVDLLSSTYG